MENNLGNTERLIRFVTGTVMLIIASASHLASGWLFYFAFGSGVAFLTTSILGICPFYKIIGFKTS